MRQSLKSGSYAFALRCGRSCSAPLAKNHWLGGLPRIWLSPLWQSEERLERSEARGNENLALCDDLELYLEVRKWQMNAEAKLTGLGRDARLS